MLSINTNLSSIIAQNSMNTATAKLNQAIERMTTGAKINHAKDNAANYSIATNMTTKMNSYMVAQDNVAIGMEMVGTAESVISQMHDHAIRLRELATQARNNTYGADSLQAIQSEANARIAEIARLYSSSEFNGISLFEDVGASPAVAMFATPRAVTTEPTFIANPKTYDDATVEAMASIDTFTDGASGEFKIEDADDLAYLATIVNDNNWDTTNATFVLADNIDLTNWQATHGNWNPIGNDDSHSFKGTFDGNGHVISNLTIDNPTAGSQGLFGEAANGSTLKNVGLEGGSVKGNKWVGMLAGYTYGTITNSYATGDVTGTGESFGGLAGYANTITNSYATGSVTGAGDFVGGLVGSAYSITNSYATGDVTGTGDYVGGLAGAGNSFSNFINSYATGDVTGNEYIGSFIGNGIYDDITYTNCFATGTATGNSNVSGFVGIYNGTTTFTNCVSVQSDPNTSQDFSASNLASMGFTEASGWTFVDGKPTIAKSYAPTPSKTPPPPAGGAGGIELQVGIHNDANSRISFNTYFQYDLSEVGLDIGSDASLSAIDDFIDVLSAKETELGAVTNRLESVLDEIEIQYNNLASSRSTIRDADIAEVSSEYIKMQILQQASSTLLATANQTPSIALQLI